MVGGTGFADFLGEQLAPLGNVTTRPMSGKIGLLCEGVMVGMVTTTRCI